MRRGKRQSPRMANDTIDKAGGNAPDAIPAKNARTRRIERANELLAERAKDSLPLWVRAPLTGPEFYCGLSRSKLYQLAGEGRIRSVSLREPGQIRGTRLFHLPSVLAFIECNEAATTERRAK